PLCPYTTLFRSKSDPALEQAADLSVRPAEQVTDAYGFLMRVERSAGRDNHRRRGRDGKQQHQPESDPLERVHECDNRCNQTAAWFDTRTSRQGPDRVPQRSKLLFPRCPDEGDVYQRG